MVISCIISETVVTDSSCAGLGNFELVNLLESSAVIGTARVKSIQVVNNEVRLYLMDIQLKVGFY